MGVRDKALWSAGDRKMASQNIGYAKQAGLIYTGRGINGTVTSLDRSLVQLIIQKLGSPAIRIRLWNGEYVDTDSSSQASAQIRINDRGVLYQLVRNAELHFGDLVSSGRLEIETDIVEFFEQVYRTMRKAQESGNFAQKLVSRLRAVIPQTNNLADAKNNIYHHYDISNDFYKLWLDNRHTQYTCAYYADDSYTLEQAQEAKLDHVCRKLQLKPGDTVVEAGCGWGGLARHMARNYGVTVRAYNISREQIAYAREEARKQGLQDQVEYIEEDYRNITGEYDVFVSVGMLEHVGRDSMTVLGAVIDRVLKPNGRGLIHSIGRNQPAPMNAWIEKRIFPGAYPPSLSEMMHIFEPQNLSIMDIENLRLHYAKTLRHWLERFETHTQQIEDMFDRHFVRAWRLYLAGSVAAFTTSDLQLFQVLFCRPDCDILPITRAHLYREHP